MQTVIERSIRSPQQLLQECQQLLRVHKNLTDIDDSALNRILFEWIAREFPDSVTAQRLYRQGSSWREVALRMARAQQLKVATEALSISWRLWSQINPELLRTVAESFHLSAHAYIDYCHNDFATARQRLAAAQKLNSQLLSLGCDVFAFRAAEIERNLVRVHRRQGRFIDAATAAIDAVTMHIDIDKQNNSLEALQVASPARKIALTKDIYAKFSNQLVETLSECPQHQAQAISHLLRRQMAARTPSILFEPLNALSRWTMFKASGDTCVPLPLLITIVQESRDACSSLLREIIKLLEQSPYPEAGQSVR